MPYPLEKDIEAAGKAGFQGIELWKAKLDKYLGKNKKEDLKKLLSEYGLGVASICPMASGIIWAPEEEFKKKLEELKPYLEVANYIGAESILVCAEGYRDRPTSRRYGLETHASRLVKAADLAKGYGVRLTFEWLGWFGPLTDGIEVINMAGNENLGILFDSYHWYRGGGDFNQIDQISIGKLDLVHVNDIESVPREELNDSNRLYPGHGIMPLVKILEMLKNRKYSKYLSVEIFQRKYWEQDPITISKNAYASLIDVMKKASI